MADEIAESTAQLLQSLRLIDPNEAVASPPSPVYCAQIKLFARTQFAFYAGFQALVFALACAVATALVLFIIRLADGVDVVGVVGILGATATGAAAGFLQTQANGAKRRYDEAREELRTAGCS